MFPDKKFPQSLRTRHETKKIYHRIRRCVCKRQHESDTKTFLFCDESENFRSSVNVVKMRPGKKWYVGTQDHEVHLP